LILSLDAVSSDPATLFVEEMFTKMMHLCVDVLGALMHLWKSNELNCSGIVDE
jgi:hypothetical protein